MQSIIFISPPAAGKGTLSGMIEEKYKIPHIAMGDIFRAKVKEDNEDAIYIKKELAAGNLISDDFTNKLLAERLSNDDTDNGFILDGFPRTINQAEELEKIEAKLGKHRGIVIYLTIDEEEALKRSLGRIVCGNCHKIYNKFNLAMAPKTEGICDVCGNELALRSDDNEESFKRRFENYLKETAPLLDFYAKEGRLYTINSSDNPMTAFNQIEAILEGVKE